jgi:hypothetical protein
VGTSLSVYTLPSTLSLLPTHPPPSLPPNLPPNPLAFDFVLFSSSQRNSPRSSPNPSRNSNTSSLPHCSTVLLSVNMAVPIPNQTPKIRNQSPQTRSQAQTPGPRRARPVVVVGSSSLSVFSSPRLSASQLFAFLPTTSSSALPCSPSNHRDGMHSNILISDIPISRRNRGSDGARRR